MHSGEKPYTCDVCKLACRAKQSLIKHNRRHTGEKPFKCDVCEYACIQKHQLVSHKRKHIGDKPYHCVDCWYASEAKNNFKHTWKKTFFERIGNICGYECVINNTY